MPRRTVTIKPTNIHLYRTGSFNSSRLVWECPQIDRQVLSNFGRLRKLVIRKGLVHNGLEGLQVCSGLRHLAIYRDCEIGPISALTNLVTLVIDSPVRNIRPILNCTRLRTLEIIAWSINAERVDLTGIENLRELRVLSVPHNVPVPFNVLALLPKITQLGVDYNGDPRALPSLRSLRIRRIDSNTAAQLKLFPQLRELTFIDDGTINLNWIKHMTRLESLSIGEESTLKNIHEFRSFPRLKYLSYYCGATDIVSQMKYCPMLRTFDCGVGDLDSLDGLGSCLNLRSVCLFLGRRTKCKSDPLSIKDLATCRSLTSFNGSYTPLGDTHIISNWTSIEDLDMAQTGVTDVSFLSSCTKLRNLIIGDNNIGDISCIRAPGLIRLDIKHTNVTTVPFERFPLLETLYATECAIKDWSDLKHCPKLTNFDAHRCGLKTMDHIQAPNLRHAYLSSNALTLFPFERYPLLHILRAGNNTLANLNGLPSCPKLRTLSIEHNLITDFSPICHLPKLESLHTRNNPPSTQDPRTTRVLQRFTHAATRAAIRTANTIYSNSQNVHDASVQLSVKKSVENLLKDPVVTYDPESVINSDLPAETKCTIVNYCSCDAVHSAHDLTYAELFAYVWARIQKHESRESLYQILAEQLSESECKCFTGRFNRTLSVLVGFCEDIFINISDSSRISAIIITTGSKLHPYIAEQHVSEATDALLEAGYSLLDIQPWLEAISEP